MAVMIPGLQIEVMYKETTVTLPGTTYTATYSAGFGDAISVPRRCMVGSKREGARARVDCVDKAEAPGTVGRGF